jgi:transcriptional regulator with XRE-family HTH domain
MKKKPDLPEFARRLTAIREAAGLSRYALAKLSGCSAVHLGRLESGERRPSWETACRLADVLEVGVEEFRNGC